MTQQTSYGIVAAAADDSHAYSLTTVKGNKCAGDAGGTGLEASLVGAELTGAADATDTIVSAGCCEKPRTLT